MTPRLWSPRPVRRNRVLLKGGHSRSAFVLALMTNPNFTPLVARLAVMRPVARTVFSLPALSASKRRKARPRVVEVSPELLPKPPVTQGVLMGFEDLVTQPSEEDVYLRQRTLRDLPPAPDRRYPRVPASLMAAREWAAHRVQAGEVDAGAARAVYLKVKQMRVRDALYCGDYRLEFIWGRRGLPHYRLFHEVYLLGIVDVPLERESAYLNGIAHAQDDDRYEVFGKQLPVIQRTLARHLVAFGWSADTCHLVEGDAKTGGSSSKRDVYRLF